MFILTTSALRVYGLCGIFGAALFIVGDLLYNHTPGSTESPAVKMSRLSESRLINAGTAGLMGSWFYLAACLHLYLAFRPAGKVFAFILLLAFAFLMVCYGISHAAYFAIAAAAKTAAGLGSDPEKWAELGNDFFKRLVLITYIPVIISSLMMVYGILTAKSLYPWWMVFFLPVIIYYLKTPLVRLLKGRLRELVNDFYDNIVFLVFFLISTVILWNGVVL